jgi:hypothetical protein
MHRSSSTVLGLGYSYLYKFSFFYKVAVRIQQKQFQQMSHECELFLSPRHVLLYTITAFITWPLGPASFPMNEAHDIGTHNKFKESRKTVEFLLFFLF